MEEYETRNRVINSYIKLIKNKEKLRTMTIRHNLNDEPLFEKIEMSIRNNAGNVRTISWSNGLFECTGSIHIDTIAILSLLIEAIRREVRR